MQMMKRLTHLGEKEFRVGWFPSEFGTKIRNIFWQPDSLVTEVDTSEKWIMATITSLYN